MGIRSVVVKCGRPARIAAILLMACVVVAGTACSAPVEDSTGTATGDAVFDVASLTWEPGQLGDTTALVGWRSSVDGAPGMLAELTNDGPGRVLWQSPDLGDRFVQVEGIAPDGSQMVGLVLAGSAAAPDRWLHFRPDGSVRSLPLPEGFEGVQDVVFGDEDILVVAYHATDEEFETRLGVVNDSGDWQDLGIRGDLPEHHFIESLVALPGSTSVGVVLKTPGGTGDRDDDALVLARREGEALAVCTTPFRDDALPEASPLLDGDGVVFARWWNVADGVMAPVLVRAEWLDGQWVERVLSTPGALSIPLEMGAVVIQEPSGAYLVRVTDTAGESGSSRLVRLPSGGGATEDTGLDATGVNWYTWLEAAAE